MWSDFAKNSSTLWSLYQQAKEFSTRPSELLGVSDAWMAFCVDNSVFTFGSALQNELEGIEGKNKKEIQNKQDRLLRKWLDLPQKFRNPGVVGSGSKDGVEEQFVVKGKY